MKPPPKRIIAELVTELGITEKQLRKKSNRPEISFPRQLAAYLVSKDGLGFVRAGKRAHPSLSFIARLLGGWHHTTILHSIQKIEELMVGEGDLADTTRDIVARVRARYKASHGTAAKP